MSRMRLFLFSLLMGLVCVAALIGYALLMQDWIASPYNEEMVLTNVESTSSSGISSKISKGN